MGKKSRLKRQRPQVSPKVIEPPPEIAAAIDEITDEDRRWFEEHPALGHRTRPAAPNEFWPNLDSANVLYVVVLQVEPGHRLRFPVSRFHRAQTERIQ